MSDRLESLISTFRGVIPGHLPAPSIDTYPDEVNFSWRSGELGASVSICEDGELSYAIREPLGWAPGRDIDASVRLFPKDLEVYLMRFPVGPFETDATIP